jgi:selenocysteine lyase/cysteine desulfurase
VNGKTYLNTASCGLLDEASLQETNSFYREMLTESSTASEAVRDQRLPQIRATVASFLSAPANNIALIPNFSWALNAVVQALEGDERVLLYRHDYPSLYEPFLIHNFDITWIDSSDGFSMDTDAIKALLLAADIEVFAISHVQWLSGFMIDIAELGAFCKAHHIIFIVDATQSLGSVPVYLDRQYADVLIASNYKWMNAGFGTGVMYLSDHFMEMYPPVVGGHNSYTTVNGHWQYTASVHSYEPGHLNLHGFMVMDAAIKQKLASDIDSIWQHNTSLTAKLLDGIRDKGLQLVGPATMENRCSIVVLKAGKDLHQYLADNGIVVTWRDGMIRISIHFYNTEADVAHIVSCLQTWQQR